MSRKLSALAAGALALVGEACAQGYPSALLWGDAHVHTNRSLDAYRFDNRTVDADQVFRFAKGEPIVNPMDGEVRRLSVPLDFVAVTDHAEFLGVPYDSGSADRTSLESKSLIRALVDKGDYTAAYEQFARAAGSSTASAGMVAQTASQTAWAALADSADRHNDPGRFTAILGWEWTSRIDGAVLHRVVLTDADAARARTFAPFSALWQRNPEFLWAFLARTRTQTGVDFIAIPHNSNLSNGLMFAPTRFNGNPLTAAIAQRRSEFETVAEVVQYKGASETATALSPADEFAGFEFYRRSETPPPSRADYLRGALLTGIEQASLLGVNPFKLGMIGSTDSHSGMPSAEEDNFTGHFALDSVYENRTIEADGGDGNALSGGGLAAVWARYNTRAEIMAALRRREVYATSGVRIKLRFFGGYDFVAADAAADDVAGVGYAKGVPMGGDLTRAADSRAPRFLVSATKDPRDGNLDRVQIVKGWLDGATAREKVFNVAWSGARTLGANGALPPVGDTVNRAAATYENSIGAPALSAVWTDPEFDPSARAFYYVRVLQIPTPRRTLYEAVAHGDPPPEGSPETIQERAWSSPIWYTP